MRLPHLLLASLIPVGLHAAVSQVITYDFNARSGAFGGSGGADHVSTVFNTAGGVINSGGGSERIEFTSATTTLSTPGAPFISPLTMTAAGSGRVEVGNNTGGGAGMPGLGVTAELANAETMTLTFDKAVAITAIDANWWDGADQLEFDINGITYQNPFATRNNNLNLATGIGGAFPTTTFTDPISGNSVTGVGVAAGSAITFSVWDQNGNGSLDGNGLLQRISFAVVPEPSRAALLGLALFGLLLRRRR